MAYFAWTTVAIEDSCCPSSDLIACWDSLDSFVVVAAVDSCRFVVDTWEL